MAHSPPLILAYDAECSPCLRWMERLRNHDCHGLLVFFPLQNPELVRIAPELAGRDLYGEIHGLEEGTRRVFTGGDLAAAVLARLPGWRWLSPLLRLPGIRACAARAIARPIARRQERFGRLPHQDRFR